ncbi:MAG: NADH-quinone oxidoreductase subunit M [Betaproteobacteria bacterium]|nr:MAG: NADH-quinone oxidoreductase subunit M [Betaproteobacteria bacterium]
MSEVYWFNHAALPLLALLQLVPVIGAAWVWRLARDNPARPASVRLGRVFALLELGLAIALYRGIDTSTAVLQFAEWLPLVGPIAYHAAADGVTVLFVLLVALLVLLLVIYSLVRELPNAGRLLAVMLALEGVLMSQLVTVNLFWFVASSAAEIALVGYLLWFWATSPEKDVMLARFYQFQGTGIALLLLGTLVLGWSHAHATGEWSFDLLDLTRVPVEARVAPIVFFMLFYGLGVRTPIFPLHGWLPVVAQHGNVAIAPVFLLGIKIGIFGLLRYVLPILPEMVVEWHLFVVGFAAAGVFYAALLAFQQSDLRRLLAFAVISHTGLLIMGIFALHPMGFQGGVLLTVNFGLAVTAMWMMTGFVYRRTHTTILARLGGLFDRIPLIGITFLVGGLAIVGMPGTPGFDAAHLVLEASIERFGALPTVAAALGNVAAAGFLLYAFQRAFLAARDQALDREVERASREELWVVGVMMTVLLVAGFYLEPWLRLVEAPLQGLASHFVGVKGL